MTDSSHAAPPLFVQCTVKSALYGAVRVEDGQRGKVSQVCAGQGVALRKDGGAAGDGAAGGLHQLFQGVKALAGGDDIVHDEDALSLDEGAVISSQEQILLAQGGDGADGDVDWVGHVDLGPLPGDEILLRAGLAGHLVNQGNGLGLGGEHVIVAVCGDLVQQGPGTVHRKLCVAEHDERANIEIIADLAEGQLPLQAGNLHGIGHHGFLLYIFSLIL